MKSHVFRSLLAVSMLALSSTGCADKERDDDPAPASTDAQASENLTSFDQLDFEAFNKQDWTLFKHLHCDDVVVTNSDGSQTSGIDAHVQSVGWLFAWSPDINIPAHPIKVAAQQRTAVTGSLTGTFTEPMPQPDGSLVPATGKAFDVPMATFATWRGGCISEEQLFLDNAALFAQIGLGG